MAVITPQTSSILNKVHLTKPWEFIWFGYIYTIQSFNPKQGASHQTLGIHMVRLLSHHIRLQSKTRCISPNPENSYGLAALTPQKASIINKVHLTKPKKITWFGCTHTTPGFNRKQGASHPTLAIHMVWLHSHHIRLQSETRCTSPNPRN